jgi:hypothetical protein
LFTAALAGESCHARHLAACDLFYSFFPLRLHAEPATLLTLQGIFARRRGLNLFLSLLNPFFAIVGAGDGSLSLARQR